MRAYDAGKKIKGRKRHIAVDTDGRLLVSTSQWRIFQTRRVRADSRRQPTANRS
jgi:hypothetical protein